MSTRIYSLLVTKEFQKFFGTFSQEYKCDQTADL